MGNTIVRRETLGALLLLLLPASVLGWSDTGHRVICELAHQELNAAARAEVTRLLALDPDADTLADACTWADHPTRRPDAHVVPVPRATRELNHARCRGTDECLFSAITADERTLGDRTAPDEARLEALKYLGHWIGDIHQPLHVAFPDDDFGASIPVDGLPCGTDLHAVWDACVVEQGFGRNAAAIATALRRDLDAAVRREWIRAPLSAWANESFKIVTTPDIRYCTKQDRICWSTPKRFAHSPATPRRTLDTAYIDQMKLTVAGCLRRAGVRLGARLNAALGPTPTP